MRSVAIIPHIRKEALQRIMPKLIDWLNKNGLKIKLPGPEAKSLGLEDLGVADEDLFNGTDFIIAMGGDGTALKVARLLQSRSLPVMGINLGKIGFLMQFEEADIYPALENILDGDYSVEERSMLRVQSHFFDGNRLETMALNEAMISGAEFNKMVELDVEINKRLFSRYALDGLIVATPTGSTAYSFSAGGPFVSPLTDLMVMTPICPHSLFNRSMVLSAGDIIKISVLKEGKQPDVRLSVDGYAIGSHLDSVTISVSPVKFKFIKREGLDFFSSLRQKLTGWDYFLKG